MNSMAKRTGMNTIAVPKSGCMSMKSTGTAVATVGTRSSRR
jgi:hypothetical protein